MKTYTIKFTAPVRKTYEVEADTKEWAFAIALDTIKRRYPTLPTTNPVFSIDGVPMKVK